MSIRWHLSGNRELAAAHKQDAFQLFEMFQRLLKTGKVQTASLARTLYDGTKVFIKVIPGFETIYIDAPALPVKVKEKEEVDIIFLYNSEEEKKFYDLYFPAYIRATEEPEDWDSEERHRENFGAVNYAINLDEGKDHIINTAPDYFEWAEVKDESQEIPSFPITVMWNVPSTCVHSHVRGGSEEDKWGTCGYNYPYPGDAIIPPIGSMPWPFRSVLPFAYNTKKKTMSPTYSIVIPLAKEEQEVEQFIENNHGISGKRNFKLNEEGAALEWIDTLEVNGVGDWNSSGYWEEEGYPAGGQLAVTYGWFPYPSPGWFFKFWYSWLHEVPVFDYFDANAYAYALQYIGTKWDLEPRSPYRFRRRYVTADGEQTEDNIFRDQASVNYIPVSESSYQSSWKDDRCPGDAEGNSHSLTIGNGNYGGNGSMNIYMPIASLGDRKYIYIKNQIAVSATHGGDTQTGTKHEDDWPCGAANCSVIGRLDCFCKEKDVWDGTCINRTLYSKNYSGTWKYMNTEAQFVMTQTFFFDTIPIETLYSNLGYALDITDFRYSLNYAYGHATPDPLWWPQCVCPYVLDEQGSQNIDLRTDVEGWSRNIGFIEVLDYDNIGTEKAVIIYKKVLISHSAEFDYAAAGEDPVTQYYTQEGWEWRWDGTRTVTYWLWYKIGEKTFKYQLIPNFQAQAKGRYGGINEENQTGYGQRLYGVSCQIGDDYILFSFLVENFTNWPLGNYGYYSSPLNWEDRNRIGQYMTGGKAWDKNRLVLGIISIYDLNREDSHAGYKEDLLILAENGEPILMEDDGMLFMDDAPDTASGYEAIDHKPFFFDIMSHQPEKTYSVGIHHSEKVAEALA